jgi:uncharacterized protein (TIGR04255 family)
MNEGTPVYPNQQLRLVSFETYFPGQLSMLSSFGAIQNELHDRFPLLFVPQNDGTDAQALKPYQLRTASLTDIFALALNQASYSTARYPGADVFVPAAIDAMNVAYRHGKVEHLSRVRYKYENEISVGADSIHAALAAVLNATWLARLCPTDVDLLSLDWTEVINHDERLGFGLTTTQHPGRVVININIIGNLISPCAVADLLDVATRVRKLASARFEEMISDAFRANLMGAT